MAVSEHFCSELQSILQQRALQPLFQPIFSLVDAEIIGFEALIRGPSDSPLHSPIQLFKTAVACRKLEPLEMLCRELSIKAFAVSGVAGKLFLNVNPLILLTSDHPSGLTKSMLQAAGLDPARVVIEISEQYQVEDAALLIKAVHHYRELGFSIAIDDLGSGFSGLKLWSELQPDIVKIDRYFISDVHRDPTKRAFVQNIIRLAKATGSQIVAEGIETEEELLLCRELGADLAQGYLLGRPKSVFSAEDLGRLWAGTKVSTVQIQDCIEQLVIKVNAVSKNTPAMVIAECFRAEHHLQSLAVVDGAIPIGLICRTDLQALFAQPFGRALYEKKTAAQIMNNRAVIVEAGASLDEVSRIVSEDEHNAASWYFIICRGGDYLGLGSVRQLLKHISEHRLHHARYANPLTLLPGNVPIYREMDKLLLSKAEFAVAYLDLNHFKPFNDVYGYSKGDAVLLLLAEIVQQRAAVVPHFVGHIGGDDFVLITSAKGLVPLCEQILADFASRITNYYSIDDINNGGLTTYSRAGELCFYPLLSLAIGIAIPDPDLCENHHDVAALTSAAKCEAKRVGGNAIFVSRRRGPDSHNSFALARPSSA